MQNTRDLRDFGIRELRLAGKLLLLFKSKKDLTVALDGSPTIEFNPDSGFVFLIDQNYNVAMETNGKLEDWLRCPNCDAEGFKNDLSTGKECCKAYAKTYHK